MRYPLFYFENIIYLQGDDDTTDVSTLALILLHPVLSDTYSLTHSSTEPVHHLSLTCRFLP